MQAEAEVENKVRAKFMNNYKWDLDKFEYYEKQVPTSFVYLDKITDNDVISLGKLYDTIILFLK